PITHVGQSRCSPSRETAAHDRLKSPLTISEMRNHLRIARMFCRRTSRKLALAFSTRCHDRRFVRVGGHSWMQRRHSWRHDPGQ
ncbi:MULTISPECIES: hypothetical protein, partial [unclassified Bradyrhizobium]|uniref:hypothetical protein n=1 Tax=unclassified Bradyrhizobium TaxID=2631580 RepID=UPI001FFB0851